MATKPQEPASSEFDDAFASFVKHEDPVAGGDPQVDDPPAPDPAPADPAPADTGDGQPDPAGGDTGGDPADGGGAADPAPAADPAADAQTDALIARLAGLVKDTPAPPPAPAAANDQPPAAQDELYDAPEKEFLAKYDEDWGDVSRGEALKRRAEYRSLIGFIFEQVASQLRPMADTVDVLSNRTHLADLRGQVEDYDTVRDKVVSWVDQQPMYLQGGMKSVIQAGTADEVADLISRYRQATGETAKPAPTPPASVELSSDAKKAAAALAPVNTKRSAIPVADDPGDFDAAFKQWATAGKER